MSPLPHSNLGQPTPRKSTAWPMFMIVCVAVAIPFVLLAMILGGVALRWLLAARAGNEIAANLPDLPPPPQPVIREIKAKQRPDLHGSVAGALGQPAAPQNVPGRTMVDLIPLIDPHVDALHGKWSVINNVLHCPDAHLVPRVQIPYQPPLEYDFLATFSQPKLRNGVSMVMPNPNGGSFFAAIGSEGGRRYGLHANPEIGGRLPGLVRPNTHHAVKIEVRKNSVKVIVNGKDLVNHGSDFRDLTCDDWRWLNNTKCLGIACDDPTVFHHLHVVEITGAGRGTR